MIGEADMLDRFEKVRRLADGSWMVCCRAHEDRRPSLHITLTPERWLLACQAGCEVAEVLAAAGLDWPDLFVKNGNGRFDVAAYDYVDERGELLFQCVRFNPKDFKQRRPNEAGGWVWNLEGTRRVLYRLPRVLEAVAAGKTIYVVEGEKDVLAVERAGAVATCNPMGAGKGKWLVEYSETLRRAVVTVVADRDRDGRAHARRIVESLRRVGATVSVVEAAAGKDAADHLAAGRSLAELVPVDDLDDVDGDAVADNTPAQTARVLPPPIAPMEVARELVAERYSSPSGARTLRHWRGGWWEWQGPRWAELERLAMSAAAYRFTETAVYRAGDDYRRWTPNREKIGDLLDALAAIVLLPDTVAMPTWLDVEVDGGPFVSVANGLLDLSTRELRSHDPRFFNSTSVPFGYDPDALDPERWEQFLEDLWGDDHASKETLGEWFGYVISGRLDQHKILLFIGPTRAGKGVTCRTLGKLVGMDNVAGPTLASLSGDFGLAPLLGKTLAVISDARLTGRGSSVVVERLLSISGEDRLTVNRKYRDQWTGKLPCRLMLCSNELPQLGDASMAVAGRFVPLILSESFYGREDLDLEDKLAHELPGILNWALDGLKRLTGQRRFTRPPGVDDTIRTLQDLASPVAAFVRDRCEAGPDRQVSVTELYRAWREWAEENGYTKSSQSVFGRDLRAALSGRLKVGRPWSGGEERTRTYIGVELRTDTP
jgi:putative DNA primase/helicase